MMKALVLVSLSWLLPNEVSAECVDGHMLRVDPVVNYMVDLFSRHHL